MGAALSKLFSWLVEYRKIAINPAVGMYKPKAPQARDRVLSEAERSRGSGKHVIRLANRLHYC
jgi:site-specific recombinase XerC